MANILVLYYSKGGNTAKMAKYVAEGAAEIATNTIRIKSIDEANADDLFWCHGIAVGSPTQLGLVAGEMKQFWEKLDDVWMHIDGKIGCAFTSQGGWGGGAEIACQSINTLLMNFGMLVFGVTDYVAHQFTTHYGATQAGEPRMQKEIDSCKRIGRRLSEWVAVYVDGLTDLHPNNAKYSRHPTK
ncbi:MAG: hypothetical protein PF541_04565 [Prolixibacteraceae bacterium]|jgi:NAD(P)H dehydrogenase (quinone)|nr:hypothetical protein [Prolixibacteraceae bacterium]